MKNSLSLALAFVLLLASSSFAADEILSYGRFGKLNIYRSTEQPRHVVLFVSGDGGWNLGVIDMARALADLDSLVVGIDITHYLKELGATKEKCSYPAADFENLSKYIQKKLGFDHYRQPILVGYSSGATLVYTLLVQAPPNTFRAAISMGFCPDLPLNKPFCKGHGLKSEPAPKLHGYTFPPVEKLENPWLAFQGAEDQVCVAQAVEAYVKKVKNAEIVMLPKVGHGFSVQKNWLPHFRESFSHLTEENMAAGSPHAADAVADLPLIEVQTSGATGELLAVILTGDGGWASIDRDIGDYLAGKGIPVVGLNTLEYFWKGRNPEEAGRDLERILRHYQAAWHYRHVLLIGYSLGAEVLPFMTAHLPQELRQRVALVALLGPGKTATFEFHLNDWLGGDNQQGLSIKPEVERLRDLNVLCIYGDEEKDSLCPSLRADSSTVKVIVMQGDHHFGGNFDKLAGLILAKVKGR